MSDTTRKAIPAKVRQPRGPKPPDGSPEAKRIAAAVLEVLGGARLPSQAAQALGISIPRYYLLETRALAGLVGACEKRPQGRVRTADSQLLAAQKEIERLKRDCARQQALMRVAQRTMGLPPPPPPKPGDTPKKRKRKPAVRALKAANLLHLAPSGETQAVAGEQSAQG